MGKKDKNRDRLRKKYIERFYRSLLERAHVPGKAWDDAGQPTISVAGLPWSGPQFVNEFLDQRRGTYDGVYSQGAVGLQATNWANRGNRLPP